MKTLEELYQDIMEKELEKGRNLEEETEEYSLDCLLHPKKYGTVISKTDCHTCGPESACMASCDFGAIQKKENRILIDPSKCSGCGVCIEACEMGNLMENREIYPVLKALSEGDKKVYAMVAPAFVGQYGENITPGKLRSAFKMLGFHGMVEVALFADILTLKEALEFEHHVKKKGDFQLTSCCCPVWIAMIRKIYHELVPHVPGAVSPMVAAGRVIKALDPEAMTVFIGPCMAKKKEAKEPDIADAVDYVLTFQEVEEIFKAAKMQLDILPEDVKEHSSKAGRIYARTSGVSQAVQETVQQLTGGKGMQVVARQGDGGKACKELIENIKKGEIEANFFEGMACSGGCVGGPKAILEKETAREIVNEYGEEAATKTPLENPFVKEVLERLGFKDVIDFVENSTLLVRHFE